MNAIEIKPAVREKTHVLVSLAGPSGCGKTYSAIKMARGLAGPDGQIGAIDTEAKRMRHYADLDKFNVADLAPPFTPLRYLEYVKAFADAGYKVLIIDSISHEWEGTGGCIEMAEGGKGLLAWQRPKSDHKKLMNYLLQVPMHVIFCARAREKMVQVRNTQTNKDEIVNQGWHAIAEKNFIFEMTVSILLDEKTKLPTVMKCPAQLLHAFPEGSRLTSESGAALKVWAEQGVDVDQAFEALKTEGREVAMLGTEQLKLWFRNLTKLEQASIKPTLDGDLKSIADEADRHAAPADDDPFTPVTGITNPSHDPEDPPMPTGEEEQRQQDDDSGKTNDAAGEAEPSADEADAAVEYTRRALATLTGLKTANTINNWYDGEFLPARKKHGLSDEQVNVVDNKRIARLKAIQGTK